MKSSVETLEPTKVKLEVEVPYEELKPALDKVYKDLSDQVNVPGFRRGHVPARIIDQRIGRGYVIEQAVNQHLGEYYAGALRENDLVPLAQPEVDVTELPNVTGAAGGKLVFTAEVEVLPALEIPSLADETVEVDPVEITDDDIDAELDHLRDRFATLTTVERAAENGDYTSIDMEAHIGDELIDQVTGVSYEVGSETMLEGLDAALTGLKAGESAEFTSTLKGGEHEGEEAHVDVTLKSVKVRELPEVDEDFVQMASEFDTVDELREDLREQVRQRKASDQAVAARDKVLDRLRELVEVPIPSGVLASELEARLGDEADDDKKAEVEKDLRDRMRDQILLDRLARDREVGLSQAELFDYIMTVSQTYGIDVSRLLEDQNQVAAFAEELTRNKALAQLLREVTVKDTDGNVVDLSQFVSGEAESDSEAEAEGANEDDE